MENIDLLTSRILRWQETGEGFQEIMTEVSEIILRYPHRHYGWQQDDCADFYCFFYNRCLKLLKYFRYQNKSFLALLNNSLSWQLRTFYRKYKQRERKVYCIKYDSIIQAEECRDSCDACRLEVSEDARQMLMIDEAGEIRNAWMRRRILILALKNAPYLADEHIEAVARIACCDESWLSAAVLSLRSNMEDRMKRLDIFNERTNRAFLEICQIHRALGICCSNCEKMMLLEKLGKVKRRLDKASAGKASVKLMPTNSEIALILQIPKGSIDSSLYYLKKYLKVLVQ